MNRTNPGSLAEIARLFFKLGAIGFGGPAAHIAMMEDEVVQRRKWLSQEAFLDLIGATNLIPGPNSTEMAIHVGYLCGGWPGLMVAGACFILPAVAVTATLAWGYISFGALPQVAPLLYGIKPAVLAVVLAALWRLGKKAVKSKQLLLIGFAVVLLLLLTNLGAVVALLLGGVLGAVWLRWRDRNPPTSSNRQSGLLVASSLAERLALAGGSATGAIATASSTAASTTTLWQLGLFFLKIGCVLFGSGYVLVAFLEKGLVAERGWLTQQQLLDAIAIGQFTPGPVSSTATFIGYLIAGLPGAIVATAGIFLPSFGFVAALNPLIPKLRSAKLTAAFLDAVNVSAVALMTVVTLTLAQATLLVPSEATGLGFSLDWVAVAIALLAAIALLRFRLNAAWLVLGGAMVGWASQQLGWLNAS